MSTAITEKQIGLMRLMLAEELYDYELVCGYWKRTKDPMSTSDLHKLMLPLARKELVERRHGENGSIYGLTEMGRRLCG